MLALTVLFKTVKQYKDKCDHVHAPFSDHGVNKFLHYFTLQPFQIRMPMAFYLQRNMKLLLQKFNVHILRLLCEKEQIVSFRQTDTPRYQHFHVPNGYYNNIGELCDVITDKLDERKTDETIKLNRNFEV